MSLLLKILLSVLGIAGAVGGIYLFVRDYFKTKTENKQLKADILTVREDLEEEIEGAKLVALHQKKIQNVKKDQKIYQKRIVEAKNGKEAVDIINNILTAHTTEL